ncbi:Heat shock protein, Metallo peptidase, MEROPS family M48B [Trichormus variabilis ATCC 29413]|uniref:Protease HtpX homolog n=2 Tax=Anabaena variabilis TaxID=264691 RepID=HTPX_TRIV2|nr:MULTISPECIES: zinc metalloprotease HtpX [Nostocaceae]Q3MH22.1 RecName: Full=Protease HtpX homolog [Trichormus variabilis ATCC 29413]ABA19714.1 Heat shock protein, Metallo peptidase, MEROPS family M48B [Trichormus variabilis ATCC 29413]MBC1213289.1 zinc metalloprotease HtpX [Trichormus variabilis ARAD]MBC1258495.1 zinc metalloprotease HtpX [Trichormus variabilis V5]MBC1267533.1 zinc metalloprotease HtpX [Trichormus variabilis FSR]MBC1304233.1 zinc metalloprotease HtpX [Trichormus variabilis
MGNQFKTLALLAALSGLLIAISYWVIGGSSGLIIGIGLAAVTNLLSWYQSDKIALAVYRAQPVSESQAPRLYRMVQRLSQRANIPMPGVYIVPGQTANAFATGRDPEHAAVAVTEGILNILPEDELEAVIAHELTHIINRDTLTQAVAATVAGAISFLAQMVSYSLWFGGIGGRDNERGGNPLGVLLTVVLAPIAATIIQLAISRTREFSADAGSARLTGNPRALARALQRLEAAARQIPLNANPAFEPLLIINSISGQFLGNLFSSHPSTEARVQALLKLEKQLPTIA